MVKDSEQLEVAEDTCQMETPGDCFEHLMASVGLEEPFPFF
jgi:hypothetical protein